MTRRKEFYEREPARTPGKRYQTTADVCRRYDKSPSTLARWQTLADLDFPKPVVFCIGGPNLWDPDALDEFDARRAEQPRLRRPPNDNRKPPPPRKAKASLGAILGADSVGANGTAAAAADEQMPVTQKKIYGRPGGAPPGGRSPAPG